MHINILKIVLLHTGKAYVMTIVTKYNLPMMQCRLNLQSGTQETFLIIIANTALLCSDVEPQNFYINIIIQSNKY